MNDKEPSLFSGAGPGTIECPPDSVSLPDLLEFALTYDGYARLASEAKHLEGLVHPVLDSIRTQGVAPGWAGIDLLRGGLFVLQRESHWSEDLDGEIEAQMRLLPPATRQASGGRPLIRDFFAG